MKQEAYEKSQFKGKVQEVVNLAESLRADKDCPRDITFAEAVKEKFNVELATFFQDLGIDPSLDSVQNIITLPDLNVRWIIPEIFREALRLGYRKAPIWPNIIIAEEQMAGLTAIMPKINMSDATPKKVNEGETIPLGSISYGSKTFKIFKIGRGIKITDEVRQYASLNVVGIFLQDFGLKYGQAMDTLAINTALNGEQTDGSESAPVIGVATAATKVYGDFLTPWLRMNRLGRTPRAIIGGEAAAKLTLNISEFKDRELGTPKVQLNLKTPVPTQSDYFIHGAIPTNKELILDPTASLIKFNAQPLRVESERIVSNQTNEFYASVTTGFAKAFRDAAIVMDSSVTFAANGFPSWMDIDAALQVNVE